MNPLAVDLDGVLAQTGGIWDELRRGRLFITGGTGFFGCWMLESLAWANRNLGLEATAVILTRDLAGFRTLAPHLAEDPAFRFHPGDVRDFLFPEGRFSHVIHAATTNARATFLGEDPLVKFDTIVGGTRRVLDFCVRCGCAKLLLTSSGAAYGRQPADLPLLPETYTGAPDLFEAGSALGEGKRAAELLCARYAEQFGFETKIARCFSFVGPYLQRDIHYAIGNFIRDALGGGPLQVRGDGTPRRSFLYAADLAVWLWTILLKGQSCRIYNVGSEREVTIAELAIIVSKLVGSSGQVAIAQAPVPGMALDRYVPSTLRTRSELHLSETINLETAIQRTAVHARSGRG